MKYKQIKISFYLFIFLSINLSIGYSQTWQEFGPFHGELKDGSYYHSMGLVNAIWINPNNHNQFVLATNSSGIWKTDDRGKTWKSKTSDIELIPGFGIRSIVANPSNQNQLLAVGGNYAYGPDSYEGKLLISEDGGESWLIDERFTNPDWYAQMVKVHYQDAKTIYLATSTQLMKSEDNGDSWKVLFRIDENNPHIDQPYQNIADFTVFSNGTIILSSAQKWGHTGQVWLFNKDNEWKQIIKSGMMKEAKGKQILCAKITEAIDSTCYVGLVIKNEIWLYKTSNNGDSFDFQDKIALNYRTGNADAGKFEIEMSLKTPNKLYLGLIEFFEWTKSGGLKMLSPSPNISKDEHDDVRTMSIHLKPYTEEEFVLMGNDGGISIYYPRRKEFESLNGQYMPTLQVYNLGISQFDNPNILIGTQDNGTFEYLGNEKKWVWISGGDGGASWVSRNGRKRFYCVNASITFDGGVRKKYYTPNQAYSGWFLDFPMEMNETETKLYFGSSKKGNSKGARLYIQETEEYRQSKGTEVNGLDQIGEIEIDPISPHVIYVASGEIKQKNDAEPRLLKSIDYGESFVDITKSPVYSSDYNDTVLLYDILDWRVISSVEMDPVYENTLYVSLTGHKKIEPWSNPWDQFRVLKSDDGGETWVDYSDGLAVEYPVNKIYRHPSAKELIFCGGDDGICYRDFKSKKWDRLGEGFPKNIAVTDIELNHCEEALYVSTYGRGVWKIKSPEYKPETVKIRGNDSINQPTFIKTNIVVKKKKSLTITTDVILANNCSIILEPKSKLIIDGGHLKTLCSNDWEKIIKEKKKILWLFNRKKGKTTLKNSGKLF